MKSGIEAARAAWQNLPVGTAITSRKLVGMTMRRDELLNSTSEVITNYIKNASSLLCREVKVGRATRRGMEDRAMVFIKTATLPSQQSVKAAPVKQPLPPVEERTLTALELGGAILGMIEDLKKQIQAGETIVKEERGIIKMLTEQNKDLNRLYKQAQQKIIELNKNSTKTMKLHELQSFRENLKSQA